MTTVDGLSRTADFCRNFPPEPIRLLARDNLFEHIGKIFADVSRVAFVEGDPLTGKSDLLAAFMRKNQLSTVGVFLSSGARHFYTPEYVRLVLAEQIHWLVTSSQANFDSVDQATFTRLLHQLQKLGKRAPITFIVDGLAEPGTAEHKLTTEILDLLPFSQSEFRFLISGSSRLFPALQLERWKPKVATLIPIGKDEASAYFSDLPQLSPKDINDIRVFCGGAIGQIAKFRDLMNSGVTAEDIFNDKEGSLSSLIDVEWRQIPKDDEIINLLAYISFSSRLLNVNQLASLSGVDAIKIPELLKQCRFVEVDEIFDSISIRSTGQKTFVQQKLAYLHTKVQERFIGELLKDPDGSDATRYLPATLFTAGNHDDLIQRLDNAHFVKLLETEKSLGLLKRHSDMGLAASRSIGNESAKARFGLASSVITGLTFSVGTKRQIKALVKLGDRDSALELALLAPTDEEKLQLLAKTAKALHQNKQLIDPELKARIRELVSEIDFESLGELATDIACDLLVVDFKLAVDLFNKTVRDKKIKIRESALDEEERRSTGRAEASPTDEKSFGKLTVKVGQRRLDKFSLAVASRVEHLSAQAIISRFIDAEPRDQLFALKQWLYKRKADPDASMVADHALDVTIKDLTRAPRIQDFREIAVVLPHIIDTEKAEKLVGRIEAQLGTNLSLGTSAESVRLEMLLQRVRYRVAPSDSELSLIELFVRIEKLSDVSVRATCLSWMLYALQTFPDPDALDGRTGVISEIIKKLNLSIDILLDSSADHYHTAKSAIYGLARADKEMAFQLVSKLNTQSRRDMGYATLLKEVVSAKAYEDSPSILLRCINSIADEDIRINCILSCLHTIATECEKIGNISCNQGVLDLWRSIRIANHRVLAGVYVYRILSSNPASANKAEKVATEIKELWPSIMVDWVRTDIGYLLVHDISIANRELAQTWLDEIATYRQSSKIPSEALGNVLYLTVSLAIRAYPVIASNSVEGHDSDFSRIAYLISSIPVVDHELALWCELGINLYYRGKQDVSKKICNEFVRKILDGNFLNNELVRERLIVSAAPLLYLNHPDGACRLLETIKDKALRDDARQDICNTIFRKKSLAEPYKDAGINEFGLDYNEVASIIALMKGIDVDSYIFDLTKRLCASLIAKRNETTIRRIQVKDFLNSLQQIVDEKLPDASNIKHDGFKIAATAYILRASAAISGVSDTSWENLLRASEAIPNVADRVVVTTVVGSCAKSRGPFSSLKWFDKVKTDLEKIPTQLDRIDRYQWVAELMEGVDKQQAVALLHDAMNLSTHLNEDADIFERQKKILDLTHDIDPTLVDKMVDLADQDKARTFAKNQHVDRLKLNKIQKEVAEHPDSIDVSESSEEEIADVCYKNLAALNGGRILHRPVEEFQKLMAFAAGISLSAAYPVWAWAIENGSRRAKANSKGEKLVAQMFDATCHAAELMLALIGKSGFNSEPRFSSLIRPGEREAVFARIADWARANDGTLIRISDPYFGPDDVDVIHHIAEAAPNSKIRVLTGKKYIRESVKTATPEEAFHLAWKNLCDVSPPETEISVMGVLPEGGHPIHDRWIITENNGLRLGTSTNSMGLIRISEISEMDSLTVVDKCAQVDKFLNREVRDWEGSRVVISTFDLY